MPRPDMSDKLIHFTSGRDEEAAFANISSILRDRAIHGSTEKIKGEYRCVCFTEAPIAALGRGLVNLSEFSKYQPFGVIYEKAFVYSQGGRPVIYQSDEEFNLLPESLRWRHMRYEPIVIPPAVRPTDFTWEREWRAQCKAFAVEPLVAKLVLPTYEWAHRLLRAHDAEQDDLIHSYTQIMDQGLAEQHREPFPWTIFVLEGAL